MDNEEWMGGDGPTQQLWNKQQEQPERAVSPAESVQELVSIDWFNQVLDFYDNSDCDTAKDAHKAKERLYQSICTMAAKAVGDNYKAAHTEGRRSALEELHPQWLKEKERADRAEAERQKWENATNYWKGQAEAATRQVPDLSSLQRFACAESWGMECAKSGPYFMVKDIQALFASNKTVCPHCKGNHGGVGADGVENDCPKCENGMIENPLSRTAQPLQQEGGKDAPFVPAGYENETEFLRQRLKDARMSIKAYRTVIRELNELMATAAQKSRASDNLQQASTAKEEPAKDGVFEEAVDAVECTNCGGRGRDSSEDNYGGDCPTCTGQGFVIAASATDAWQEPIEDPVTVPRGLLGAACHAIERKKDAPTVLAKLREFTTGARSGYRATPAQATPEGAELPPLPKPFGVMATTTSIGTGKLNDVYTADQMRDYARAAVAALAGQKAEPVAWLDLDKLAKGGMAYATNFKANERQTPLYRAAPPQQVDTGGLPG